MFSEILEILGLLATPIKKDEPKDSRKNFTIFVSYVLGIVCLIFIIPELKAIMVSENPWPKILKNVVASICLTFLLLYLFRKLNLLNNIAFSTFITLTVSVYLFFSLIIFMLKDYILL